VQITLIVVDNYPRETAISVENRQFFPPLVYLTHPLKGFPWNWVSLQRSEETRMVGYQMVEKVL